MVNSGELNTASRDDSFVVTGDGPFYCNIRHVHSWQGFSLTSKGAGAAPGRRFRSGHIHSNENMKNVKAHTISVMATEDNTVVTFSDFKTGVLLEGQSSSGGTTNDFSVTLNQYESYVVAVHQSNTLATNNANGLNGTLITSDKDIVVNTGSWLAGAQGNGRDIGMDQLVPVTRLSNKYVFTQGDGNNQTERPLVVADEDGTEIYVNGSATPVVTLNAGDYSFLPRSSYSNERNIYVEGSKRFYMYQSLSGPNTASTGLNFIPPLRCNGATEVIVPNVDLIGAATISIIARTGSDLFVNGSATALTGAQPVTGNSCWVTYEINNASGEYYITADSVMNVALVNKRGVRGAGGFFSGFSRFVEVERGDTATFVVCGEETETFITYSLPGPYQTFEYMFDDPSSNSTIINNGSSNDTLYVSYLRGSNASGIEYADVQVCKLISCCGADPDTVCEISRVQFNNVDIIPAGQDETITVCQDTSEFSLFDVLPATATLGGTWFDSDGTGLLFGDVFKTNLSSEGTYTYLYVVETNAFCSDSLNVTVIVEPLTSSNCCRVDPTLTAVNPICFGDANGSIQVTDNYANEFSLDGVTYNSDAIITGLSAGSFVVYSKLGQCEDTTQVTLSEPDDMNSVFLIQDVDCFGNCSGELNVTPNGGTSPYTFAMNGASPVSSGQFQNLCEGFYTVEVFDVNNCSESRDFQIIEPDELELSVVSFADEACGQVNGSIVLTAQGGTEPYTFTTGGINNGTDSTFSGLPASTYTLTVTDANGCTKSVTQQIQNLNGPTASIVKVEDMLCFALPGSAIIGATSGQAPYSYSLDGGLAQTNNEFTFVFSGPHTVTVTDANNCSSDVDFNITEPTLMSTSTVPVDEVCSGQNQGELRISTSGGVGPYYTNFGFGNIDFTNSYTATGLDQGVYLVTTYDVNGCSTTDNVTIGGPDVLEVASVNVVDATCNGSADGEISVTGSGGTGALLYSLDGGTTTQSTGDFNMLVSGDYVVTVIDNVGCTKDTLITIGQPESFSAAITSTTGSTCGGTGGEIVTEVQGSGAVPNFTWELVGQGQTLSNQSAGVTFSNLSPGLYTVRLTDAIGCIDTIPVGVADNSLTVEITNVSIIDVDCFGDCNGSIEIEANGGVQPYTYALNNTNYGAQTLFNSLCAEDYVAVVQDANGCVSTYNVSVEEPDLIEFDVVVTDLTCYDDATGALDVQSIQGGIGPYEISFDGVSYDVTSNLTGLDAGSYEVFIQDDSNCIVSQIVENDEAKGDKRCVIVPVPPRPLTITDASEAPKQTKSI